MLGDTPLVAAGAAAGAALRHGASTVGKRYGSAPSAILCVNVIGSFFLGVLSSSAGPKTSLLLGTGFCGGFTTFSTFSVDSVRMLQNGNNVAAASYILGNNVVSIGAAAAGMRLGGTPAARRLLSRAPPLLSAVGAAGSAGTRPLRQPPGASHQARRASGSAPAEKARRPGST